MNELKNFKNIKYYIVSYSDGYWGGFVDHFATKKEAEECVAHYMTKNDGCDYTITEKSIVEFIEDKCEREKLSERVKITMEKSQYYHDYWKKEYEKKLVVEIEKIRQETKDILLKLFNVESQTEVES